MYRQQMRRWLGRFARRSLRPLGYLDLSVVYRLDLTKSLPEFQARIPIDITIGDESHIPTLVSWNDYHTVESLRDRMRSGSLCFLAWHNGELAGHDWLALRPVRDDSYIANIDGSSVYGLDAMTHPDFRGNGIHTALLAHMLAYAKARGYRHIYTRVNAMNAASWKSHIRTGWTEVGMTGFLYVTSNLFGKCWLKGPGVYPLEILEHQEPVSEPQVSNALPSNSGPRRRQTV